MFYFKLFKVATIGVIYIVLVNMFIYKILIEYDKSVKVRNYKKKKGFFPKFSRLLFTISYIVLLISFPILVVYYFFSKSRMSHKSSELVGKEMIGQVFVVLGIVVASIKVLYATLYYFDAPNRFIVFYSSIGKNILYFSIVFWILLYIKKNIILYKERRKSFNLMSEKYEGLTYKEKCAKIDEDYDLKSFNDTYCVMYDTEEEWYNSPETQKTYGFYYKLFQVYSPIWIIIINIIFGIFYIDVLPRDINTLFYGKTPAELLRTFEFFSINYYTLGTLLIKWIMIYGALVYILTPLATPKHQHTKKEKIVIRLLQLILLVLIILSGVKYYKVYEEEKSIFKADEKLIENQRVWYYENEMVGKENYSNEFSISFDQYQKLISDALKNEDNLETYAFGQQVQYLTSNFHTENNRLDIAGYKLTGDRKYDYFQEKYDADFAVYGGYDEKSIKEAKTKGYVCYRDECSISIPLSNNTFNHIVIQGYEIKVYYNEPDRKPVYLSINDYTKEKGEYYLSKYKSEFSKRYGELDLSNLTDMNRNVLLIAAFEIGENEGDYKDYVYIIGSLNELEQKLNDIYEAYQITVEEVNKLFEDVTNE